MPEDDSSTGAVSAGGGTSTVRSDGAQLQPGQRIGHYKILEQIGEGGFAIVYLAEQEKPIRRRVALKIIKLGMDTKQVIARFEAERQALAMMDHANVAKVFDAGTTDTGRPYFVMEHVPGVSNPGYCERQRLNIHKRLKLFMQVRQAVRQPPRQRDPDHRQYGMGLQCSRQVGRHAHSGDQHAKPLLLGRSGKLGHLFGAAMGRQHLHLVRQAEIFQIGQGCFHQRPVGFTTHPD